MSSSIGLITEMMAEYNYKALFIRQVRVRGIHGNSLIRAYSSISPVGAVVSVMSEGWDRTGDMSPLWLDRFLYPKG